ncbi:MAG: hypothetical protein COB33_009670 [Thiotrichaceae bacterium]|nr:hypothetical protein [Thiotrichaceae bacterium]
MWGSGVNGAGQLGNGTNEFQRSQIQVGSDQWLAVAVGESHSIGIKNDGSLWGWGSNFSGQIGNGSMVSSNVPVLISSAQWRSVSAGSRFSIAVKEDNSLWAWGNNGSGQLGDGDAWRDRPQLLILPDTEPPTGSMVINRGDLLTNNSVVTLTLSCSDNMICASMQFSNDQLSWPDLENYRVEKQWALSNGDGEKTVYVRFFDDAGNQALYSAAIVLDTERPVGLFIINNGDSSTDQVDVKLTLACSDNRLCASMQFSNDQLNWSDLENYHVEKQWALSEGDGEKTVYVRFVDDAGNEFIYSSAITLSLPVIDEDDSSGAGSMGLMVLMLLLSSGLVRVYSSAIRGRDTSIV